jgi:uncharacterized protein (DUF983 family)
MGRAKPSEGRPRTLRAALSALCPGCGAKTLFTGPARFATRCINCGLDFESFNVGDGPAALLTLALGALIMFLAIMIDIAFDPPFWVQLIIWVPATAALTIISLRIAKAALLALAYRNQAGETGRDDLA